MDYGLKVGKARMRYGVKAPAVTGHEMFERRFRVQQNTLEQLIAFLPGLYLFSFYFNPVWAAAIGVVYLVGREMYAMSYAQDPAKRGGFGIAFLAVAALIAGGLIGAILSLV